MDATAPGRRCGGERRRSRRVRRRPGDALQPRRPHLNDSPERAALTDGLIEALDLKLPADSAPDRRLAVRDAASRRRRELAPSRPRATSRNSRRPRGPQPAPEAPPVSGPPRRRRRDDGASTGHGAKHSVRARRATPAHVSGTPRLPRSRAPTRYRQVPSPRPLRRPQRRGMDANGRRDRRRPPGEFSNARGWAGENRRGDDH